MCPRSMRTLFLPALLSAVGCVGTVDHSQPTAGAASPDEDPTETPTFLSAAFGDHLPGMTADEITRFNEGETEFATAETVADGLGPVFNDTACGNCHTTPSVGGNSSSVFVTRFGTTTFELEFDPLERLGGSLIQVHGIGPAGNCNFVGEVVPPQATIVAHRRTTALFGLGLVDAVNESTFFFVADFEAANFPDEAGFPNVGHDIKNNRDAAGRFGWKAQNPTLHQFAGDAYLNEMGITNPEFPNENCPQGNCALLACNPKPGLNDDGSGVTKFTDFMTFLAPPPVPSRTLAAALGRAKFREIGCNHCHWASFKTGNNASAALNQVTFHPFSDFMLHDMGSLGDGIEQGLATGGFIKTVPLWGVHTLTKFLHDGRADSLENAVLGHAGQAQGARDRFAALSDQDRANIIAFLNSI